MCVCCYHCRKFNSFLIITQLFNLSSFIYVSFVGWSKQCSLANHAQINILFNHTTIVCSFYCLLAVCIVRVVSAISWLCMNESKCLYVCKCVCEFNCFIWWWMFAFRMDSSNKTHSLIHRLKRTHEHPCPSTNHRHCNVRCALYDVCSRTTM